MWNELGIAATKDVKAIRRAYAGRLKAMNPDADPAAFQRLRHAYDWALHMAALPDYDEDDETYDDDAEDGPDIHVLSDEEAAVLRGAFDPSLFADQASPEPAPRPGDPDDLARALARQEIDAALAAGDTSGAVERFTRAFATGLIGIDERDYALAHLMPAVVADRTIPPADYLALLHRIGWDEVPRAHEYFSATRRDAAGRGEAERWYIDLEKSAARSNWPWENRRAGPWLHRFTDSRAARFFLEDGQFMRLTATGMTPLAQMHHRYELHKQWVGYRFDPGTIAHVERALRIGRGVVGARRILLSLLWGLLALVAALACVATLNPAGAIGVFFLGRAAYRAYQRWENSL